MRFERTHDMELVRGVMRHPKIYPHLTDDGCPPAEEFEPMDHPAVWYVRVLDGDEFLGLWVFAPENAVCWRVHTCLLPAAWGKRAREAAVQMAAWIWENTPCRRLVTTVPSHNRLALKLAEAAGMRRYGLNEKSYLKRGELRDQILLGLSPEEKPCQQ
jgi:RimJ/RimL family protein N-acetyltransferase